VTAVEPVVSAPLESVALVVVTGGTDAKVAPFDSVKVIEPAAKSDAVAPVVRTTTAVELTKIVLEPDAPMKFSEA